MRNGAAPLVALGLALLVGTPASAEIYRWTDAQGEIHFSEDPSQIPPAYRASATKATASPSGASPVQTYSVKESSRPVGPASPARAMGAGPATPRVFRVPVERAGTAVLVNVRLNDQLTVPFQVDTGASDVTIPLAVANALGIQIGPDTRSKIYATANGLIRQPEVMLDSVDLGGARVDGVPASVSPSMGVGLLGLSFFNHFTYQIDAEHGVLTLEPNKLAENGLIRGGRSEAEWRAEFQNLRMQLQMVRGPRDGDPTSTWSERVEARRAALRQQLDQLEDEADQAHVPQSWRD